MSDCPGCIHFKLCYLQNEQGTFELSVCAVDPAIPKVIDPEAHKGCPLHCGVTASGLTEAEWELLEDALVGYLDKLVYPEKQRASVEALQVKLKQLKGR